VADVAGMQPATLDCAAATVPGWSEREPCFFSEWEEKEAA